VWLSLAHTRRVGVGLEELPIATVVRSRQQVAGRDAGTTFSPVGPASVPVARNPENIQGCGDPAVNAWEPHHSRYFLGAPG
jgi:hypothetical protein